MEAVLETARRRGMPPDAVIHDATPREMARPTPTSADALRSVKGIGIREQAS
jgi:hypothetical protein